MATVYYTFSLLHENTWFDFKVANFEPFEIVPDRASGGYSPDSTWEMNYTLLSSEFICINILPDKTIVYYNEDEKIIRFTPLNNFKLVVQ